MYKAGHVDVPDGDDVRFIAGRVTSTDIPTARAFIRPTEKMLRS